MIAHEVTGPTTSGQDMRNLIFRCIDSCQKIGLIVKAVVSDMGSTNKAMWKELNVGVTRQERQTSFVHSETVYTFADVPHLIKNLRSAALSGHLILPEFVCIREGSSTRCVTAGSIKYLWI